MHRLALRTSTILICAWLLALLAGPALASTPPPLPYGPWGTLKIGGATAPAGAVISAWIGSTCYASLSTTYAGWYDLHVPGDILDTPAKEGGVAGEPVVFKVNGMDAAQTGAWSSGASPQINLTAAPAFWSVPTRWSAAFGASTGWTSQDAYPRLIGDVNGDGRADVVGFGGTDVWVSLSAGSGLSAMRSWSRSFCPTTGWTSQDTYPRLLGDVNGDGKADVVGFGGTDVWVALSTGSAFGAMRSWNKSFCPTTGWTSQDRYPRALADVNGDGKADVVGFGAAGVYVALATPIGAGTLATSLGPMRLWSTSFGYLPAAGGWVSQNSYPRLLADVNGDAKADVVGFGGVGTYVALSTGNAFGPMARWTTDFGANTGWTSLDAYPRTLGDLNIDGKADVVGFGWAGTYLSISTGHGWGPLALGLSWFGAAPSAGGWTGQNTTPRFAADINHDHRLDLVGFGSDGVWVSLCIR